MADHVYALTPAALTELAGTVMATSSFQDLLQTVADLAGRAVSGAATCGITVRSPPTVPDSLASGAREPASRYLGRRGQPPNARRTGSGRAGPVIAAAAAEASAALPANPASDGPNGEPSGWHTVPGAGGWVVTR